MSVIRYVNCGGDATPDQRKHALGSALHPIGDMVLVWVNEGDLLDHGTCMEDAPLDPETGLPNHMAPDPHGCTVSFDPMSVTPLYGFPEPAPVALPYSGGPFAQNRTRGRGRWVTVVLIFISLLILAGLILEPLI